MDLFSLPFIILIAATFLLYYVVFLINKLFKRTIIPQWLVLLVASLVFYGFTNPFYLIFIGASTLVSYLVGILVQYELFDDTSFHPVKKDNHLDRRAYENTITALAIIINVSVLAVLKYYNFFASSVNAIFHLSTVTANFIIPIGISFYTFSLIAYNVDCCKRETIAEKNPLKFLLFVSYFPKVLQGPISSYDKLKEDGLFSQHSFIDNNYLHSFFRIASGLLKKIVIANIIGMYVDSVYTNLADSYGISLLITSVLYAIQLYCDFSGFMDIAIGISGLFGIKLEENFNVPYLAKSIQEFWRRWHITLGAWLKKYIYIPLGGNRVPIWRWMINILIVWFISGLWHGARFTFITWGLYHGVLLILFGLPHFIEKDKEEKKQNFFISVLKVMLTFLLVDIGWILFRSSSLHEASMYFSHMINLLEPNQYHVLSDKALLDYNWIFITALGMVAFLILVRTCMQYQNVLLCKCKKPEVIKYIATFIVTVAFISLTLYVYIYLHFIGSIESSSAFIYFDF